MNYRNHELDILKGVGITLMVFDHLYIHIWIHTYIQSFHMPLFFIISGYLWKQRTIQEVIKRRAKSLLVPYCVFSILFVLLGLCGLSENNFDLQKTIKAICLFPTDRDNMPIITALWFLPCMFISSVVFCALGRIKRICKLVCITFITASTAVWSYASDHMLPFCLEAVAPALAFLAIGESIHMNKLDEKVFSKNYVFVLFLITEFILAFINDNVDMRSARFRFLPLYYFNSVIGTLGVWGLIKWLRKTNFMLISKLLQLMENIGSISMVFLCLHQLPIFVLTHWLATIMSVNTIIEVSVKVLIFLITMAICLSIASLVKKQRTFRMLFGIN